jgi:hypothetical protein
MKRAMIAGLALLAGCQSVIGPARRGCLAYDADSPCYTPEEQQQRVRDRLPVPDGSAAVGPSTDADEPSRRGVRLR